MVEKQELIKKKLQTEPKQKSNLIQVKPGALNCTTVTIMFIEPSKDEVIKNTIPTSQTV